MLTMPVVIESDPGRSDVVDRVIEMLATQARVAEYTAAPAFHPLDAV
jgi:hypothetical protein